MHGSQLRLARMMIGNRLINGDRVQGGLTLDHFLGRQKARQVGVGVSTVSVQRMRQTGDDLKGLRGTGSRPPDFFLNSKFLPPPLGNQYQSLLLPDPFRSGGLLHWEKR